MRKERSWPIFLGRRYTSCLYRPTGALNSSIRARACRAENGCISTGRRTATGRDRTTEPTWVVAVMDNTNVGTVEQLRFRRRPWEMRAQVWSALTILNRVQNCNIYCYYVISSGGKKMHLEKHCSSRQGITSASRTTLFPSGQMMWSTWERTLSQVSSGLRRLAWGHKQNMLTLRLHLHEQEKRWKSPFGKCQ